MNLLKTVLLTAITTQNYLAKLELLIYMRSLKIAESQLVKNKLL